MGTKGGQIDVRQVIAEVAKRHRIMLHPDDAVFAMVTINELVLERTVQEAIRAMEATLERFDTSIERAEIRAGKILAQSVKAAGESICHSAREDVRTAAVKADELVCAIRGAHRERAGRLWSGIALLCATLLCAGSFWLGRLTVVR
jgi:hypothetical protein